MGGVVVCCGGGGDAPGVRGRRVLAGDVEGRIAVYDVPAAGPGAGGVGCCAAVAGLARGVWICGVKGLAGGPGPEVGVREGGVGERILVCGCVGEGVVEEGADAAGGEV